MHQPPVYENVREDKKIRPIFKERFREILMESDVDGVTNKSELKEELGYSDQRISSYLNKEKFPEPSFVTVAAIANVLNVSLDYLAGNSEKKVNDDGLFFKENSTTSNADSKKPASFAFQKKMNELQALKEKAHEELDKIIDAAFEVGATEEDINCIDELEYEWIKSHR